MTLDWSTGIQNTPRRTDCSPSPPACDPMGSLARPFGDAGSDPTHHLRDDWRISLTIPLPVRDQMTTPVRDALDGRAATVDRDRFRKNAKTIVLGHKFRVLFREEIAGCIMWRREVTKVAEKIRRAAGKLTSIQKALHRIRWRQELNRVDASASAPRYRRGSTRNKGEVFRES